MGLYGYVRWNVATGEKRVGVGDGKGKGDA
jgi:hypothetical protein